jgi:hypothetical protein
MRGGDSLGRFTPMIDQQHRQVAAMAAAAERPQMLFGLAKIVVASGDEACGDRQIYGIWLKRRATTWLPPVASSAAPKNRALNVRGSSRVLSLRHSPGLVVERSMRSGAQQGQVSIRRSGSSA